MQNRQKLMIFEQENGQKPHFSPFLALIGPFLGQHISFQKYEELTSAKPQTNEIPDCTEEPYDWETSTGISLEPAA